MCCATGLALVSTLIPGPQIRDKFHQHLKLKSASNIEILRFFYTDSGKPLSYFIFYIQYKHNKIAHPPTTHTLISPNHQWYSQANKNKSAMSASEEVAPNGGDGGPRKMILCSLARWRTLSDRWSANIYTRPTHETMSYLKIDLT